MRRFFSFPNPVNDAAARTVAIGVVIMSLLTFFTGWTFLLVLLTYGFFARVLAGPKISPLGQFAVRLAGPRCDSLAPALRNGRSSSPGHQSVSPKP